MAPVLDMLLPVVVVLFATARAAFVPADNYLLLCGTAASAAVDGRTFVGDAGLPCSALFAPQSAETNASAGSVPATGSGETALYQSARVFPAPSVSTFAINTPGRHFVRLHFFPFRYQSGDLAADAKFNVTVQSLVVIHGYTPNNGTAVVREFSVNVAGDTLAIEFTPTGKVAFVNAFEVVSHADDLYVQNVQTVNPSGQYTGLPTQALETVHRINMGSPKITPNNDTLWKTWLPDRSFLADSSVAVPQAVPPTAIHRMSGLATAEAAPDMVYATATEFNTTLLSLSNISVQSNMTWRFQAPLGSAYLLRLHFCDFIRETANAMPFNVYVGRWSVLREYQISDDTYGAPTVPLYRDFVLNAKDVTSNITVTIGTSTLGNANPDGFLNGLEIMIIVGSTGSGGAGSKQSDSKLTAIEIVAISALVGGVVVMALALFVVQLWQRKKLEKKSSSTVMSVLNTQEEDNTMAN